MIFDLDPTVAFSDVKHAALDIRQRLKKRGLARVLKCTGGKGLHIIVPLAPKVTGMTSKAIPRRSLSTMEVEAPEKYVAAITKSKRLGKILIDFFRSDYTATGIASYSVRARPGAPVAVPLGWRDLARLEHANPV